MCPNMFCVFRVRDGFSEIFLVLMGACLFKCFKIMEDHMTISLSIESLSGTKVSRSFDSSARKLSSLECLKHR